MFNPQVLKNKRKVLIERLLTKTDKELKALKSEWEKLYEMAKREKIKISIIMHKEKIEIIEEALKRKQRKK